MLINVGGQTMSRLWFMDLASKKFKRVTEDQGRKGLEKYGRGLHPGLPYDWCDMALEEMADGVQYLMAEKYRRNEVIHNINALVMQLKEVATPDDALRIANEIEEELRYLAGKLDRSDK